MGAKYNIIPAMDARAAILLGQKWKILTFLASSLIILFLFWDILDFWSQCLEILVNETLFLTLRVGGQCPNMQSDCGTHVLNSLTNIFSVNTEQNCFNSADVRTCYASCLKQQSCSDKTQQQAAGERLHFATYLRECEKELLVPEGWKTSIESVRCHIDVGDRVIAEGGHSGQVMTIFQYYTEERRNNKPVMVGILLDKKKGNCDGTFAGVRHFACESYFGMFVENFEVRPETASNALRRSTKEMGTLSRTNSIRSINSIASDFRPSLQYGAPGRRSLMNPRREVLGRPSTRLSPITQSQTSTDSNRKEMDSLKSVIEDLTFQQSETDVEIRTLKDQIDLKNKELLDAEIENQRLRVESESLSFELEECRSILNAMGFGQRASAESPSKNVIDRMTKLSALISLYLSLNNTEDKERLTDLFNRFVAVPSFTTIGTSSAAVTAFEKALSYAEDVIPKVIDRQSNPQLPSEHGDLISDVTKSVHSMKLNSNGSANGF